MERKSYSNKDLDARQVAKFAGLVAAGHDRSTAYRKATGISSNVDVGSLAARLLSRPAVASLVNTAGRGIRDNVESNLRQHLADLARLRDSAEALGQMSAAIAAEGLRGRALGLYGLEASRLGTLDEQVDPGQADLVRRAWLRQAD